MTTSETSTLPGFAADGIPRIDAICGGFPCQDISTAGKGAGLDGERSGLWREYARLIGELRPRYVIVENVGAIRGRGLAAVLGDFASLGYDAEWHSIPAAAVGAYHLRDRVWIVAANTDGAGQRAGRGEGLYRSGEARSLADFEGQIDPDTDSQRCERSGKPQHSHEQSAPRPEPERLGPWGRWSGQTVAEPERERREELRGLFGSLARSLAAASTPWDRTTEPPLRRMDDGIPARLDRPRLKALGNAVVPIIPELIGRALLQEAA